MGEQPPTMVLEMEEPTAPGPDGGEIPSPEYVSASCETCGRSGWMLDPGVWVRTLCPRCQAREIMGADPATEAVRAVYEVRERTRHKWPHAPRAKVVTRLMHEHGCGLPAAEAALEKAQEAGYLVLERGLPRVLRIPLDGRQGGRGED